MWYMFQNYITQEPLLSICSPYLGIIVSSCFVTCLSQGYVTLPGLTSTNKLGQ